MQGTQGALAQETKNNLAVPESGSPLDFIKANLKTVEQKPSIAEAAEKIVTGEKVVEVKAPETKEVEAPKTEAPRIELPKIEPPKVEPVEAKTKEGEEEETEGKESWKGIRNKLTRAANRQKELEAQLELERQEKEKILKGEVEIEPLKKLKDEVSNLSKYRDMYDLESNPEFVKNHVEPLNQVKATLQKYAEEYHVPLKDLEALVNEESVSKVNRYLGTKFDPVGASEVKNLLHTAKNLQDGIAQAKAAPRQSLDSLMRSSEEATRAREIERCQKLDGAARSSWVKAAGKLQAQEKFPELHFRNDPQHDEIVKGIFDNAAKEFGIFVQYMADAGVKELPEPIAEILAERFVRSELANSIAESRSIIFNEYQEVLKSSMLKQKYDRPPLGSTFRGGSVTASDAKTPNSPLEAGDAILRNIGIYK